MIGAIRNARISDVGGLVDLVVESGRIANVRPAGVDGGGGGIDAGGRAVLPGLVDAHVHLDKAYQLEALLAAGSGLGGLRDAIRATSQINATLSDSQRWAAAERLLGRMIRHGTTAARVHVEIDGAAAGDAVGWHVDLARAWADRVTLQLVAFPQHGLFAHPATLPAMEAALDHGCEVVGGCPYADPDPVRHIDEVFELAARRGRLVDFHLDFTADPSVHDVDRVIERAREASWPGRVAVGHLTSLAVAPDDERRRRISGLAEAGIGVISLPATDRYLVGAMAPLPELVAAGVPVAIATNNTCNAFTPYGDGSLLQTAWLAGIVPRLGPGSGHRILLDAVTAVPTRLLGLGSGPAPPSPAAPGPARVGRVGPGAAADLVVVGATHPDLALAGPAEVLVTVKAGVVTWKSPWLTELVREGPQES